MTPRRPNGSGSVRQRGKGKWQLRVYTGSDPKTGSPHQRVKTISAPSRTAALKVLAEFVKETDPLSDLTLEQQVTNYREMLARMVKLTEWEAERAEVNRLRGVLQEILTVGSYMAAATIADEALRVVPQKGE